MSAEASTSGRKMGAKSEGSRGGKRPSTSKGPHRAGPSKHPGQRPAHLKPPQKPFGRPRSEPAAVVDLKGKGKKKVDDSLDLSNQPLDLGSLPELSKYSNLHKLDLSNCSLTAIGWVSQVKDTLSVLNASGNDLSGPKAWKGLEKCTKLFVLNVSNCKLTALPKELEQLVLLKALVVGHNELTSLDALPSLADLNTLVASNNSLSSLPKDLAQRFPELKKLSAAHNELTHRGLPDLTSAKALREVRLNDNRDLRLLPESFATWGKAGREEEPGAKHPVGLNILDLGNCGFKEWTGLRHLVSHPGITNAVLKGNEVVDVARRDGTDEYRRKITILLPKLRVLDGTRFDPKFFDLKAKKLAELEAAKAPPPPPVVAAAAKPVAEKAQAGDGEKVEKLEKPKKKKKKEKKEAVVGEGEPEHTEETEAADDEDGQEADAPKPRKRGRRAKKGGKKEDGTDVATTTMDIDDAEVAARSTSKKSGALSALQGPEKPRQAAADGAKKRPRDAEDEEEQAKEGKKQEKSSVVKVIDVRKNRDKKRKVEGEAREGTGVDALLGLGGEDTEGGKSTFAGWN